MYIESLPLRWGAMTMGENTPRGEDRPVLWGGRLTKKHTVAPVGPTIDDICLDLEWNQLPATETYDVEWITAYMDPSYADHMYLWKPSTGLVGPMPIPAAPTAHGVFGPQGGAVFFTNAAEDTALGLFSTSPTVEAHTYDLRAHPDPSMKMAIWEPGVSFPMGGAVGGDLVMITADISDPIKKMNLTAHLNNLLELGCGPSNTP